MNLAVWGSLRARAMSAASSAVGGRRSRESAVIVSRGNMPLLLPITPARRDPISTGPHPEGGDVAWDVPDSPYPFRHGFSQARAVYGGGSGAAHRPQEQAS